MLILILFAYCWWKPKIKLQFYFLWCQYRKWLLILKCSHLKLFFWGGTMNVLGFAILSGRGLLQLVMDLFLSHIAHNSINKLGHVQLWPPASLPVTLYGLPCLWGVLDTDHWTTINLTFPLKERLATFVCLLFFCWSYLNFFCWNAHVWIQVSRFCWLKVMANLRITRTKSLLVPL